MSGAVRALCVVTVLALALTGSAARADVADFYRGKNLRVFVGYAPGTGYDVYARVLGRHLAKHMPGQPTVVIQNMPGAASLTMVNYMYNVAPHDGTEIGLPARVLFVEPLFGNDNARFDAKRFTWIGSMSRDVAMCFTWHTSGVTTIADAMQRELLVGASGVNTSSYQFPLIVNAFTGTRFKPIPGYPDSAAVGLAMQRGELDGYCSFTYASIKSARPDWLDKKQINLLLQLTLHRHPELPDVPAVTDFAKDDASRQALALVFADQEMGRPVFAPPDIPPDRAEALRTAFMATMKDPEFLDDAARTATEIDPIDFKAVEQVISRIYSTPPVVIERVKAIIGGR